ncbi:hypothetical protein [Micromonospora cathayae]|uniref:MYXO-CTERM domain-containing protein n=1 Tax=Micromonospora cathayae TaxID=3028804 RepID=A0ABY7ZIK7_9ACTN|nr:hypothetical protein [Micromonospora sp. HUAS 3]WDZ82725.1 hypothetical protein PVK37_19875 [Micromonospora sp. HUAS 3]
MTWDRPAGTMRGSRGVAVAVVVAALLFLHALQCATGRDTVVAPLAATAPAAVVASYDDLTSVALTQLTAIVAPADGTTADGHHPPADGGMVATACVLLLVIGATVVLWLLRRWPGQVTVGGGVPGRPVGPVVTVRLLSLLCVSRR